MAVLHIQPVNRMVKRASEKPSSPDEWRDARPVAPVTRHRQPDVGLADAIARIRLPVIYQVQRDEHVVIEGVLAHGAQVDVARPATQQVRARR